MVCISKLNLGIIGLGFGTTIIDELNNSEDKQIINPVAVYDLDGTKTRKISRKYDLRACTSLENMLNDKDIHVIGLFTPPVGRSELIEKIMISGKDIMTTKPFDLDYIKAYEVLKKSQKMGRVIHVNSPGISEGSVITVMKEAVQKHDLGMPIGARCDTWVNYHEQSDGSWYDDPMKCPVAPIFRLGIYTINDLVRLFGSAKKVSTMSSRLITERPTPDNSQITIMFKNGAIANIYCSFCVDDSQRYKGPMIINFERGTFYYNVMPDEAQKSNVVTLVRKGLQTGSRIVEQIAVTGPGGGAYQWGNFHKCVIDNIVINDQYINDIVEGIKILNAMEQADIYRNIQIIK